MSEGQNRGAAVDEDAEHTVAEFLRDHPDFFSRHLELLETLRIPHECRPAVSLIERQLSLLREQNDLLRKRLLELVDVARDNDCLSERMQRLTLGIIEAGSLDDLLQAVKSVLRDEFNADFTALRLAARPVETALAGEEEFFAGDALSAFESLLRSDRPRCGPLSSEQAQCLFNGAAPLIASAALVPLRGIDWHGVLAVGSQDKERFHRGMGTLFLKRMGELISYALQPYLRPAPLDSANP